MEKMSPFFFYFFVTFRYSDLYTYLNSLSLSLYSAGHRDAGLIIETPFVTFVPIVTWEKMLHVFMDFFEKFLFCYVTLHSICGRYYIIIV